MQLICQRFIHTIIYDLELHSFCTLIHSVWRATFWQMMRTEDTVLVWTLPDNFSCNTQLFVHIDYRWCPKQQSLNLDKCFMPEIVCWMECVYYEKLTLIILLILFVIHWMILQDTRMFLLATENDFYMNVSGGVRESIYVF